MDVRNRMQDTDKNAPLKPWIFSYRLSYDGAEIFPIKDDQSLCYYTEDEAWEAYNNWLPNIFDVYLVIERYENLSTKTDTKAFSCLTDAHKYLTNDGTLSTHFNINDAGKIICRQEYSKGVIVPLNFS